MALERLRSMTLQSFQHRLFKNSGARRHPAWLLQANYSQTVNSSGVSYCPACLRADLPYARLHWRLAFFSCCIEHAQQLCYACPHCGRGVWPSSVRASLDENAPVSLSGCAHCGGRLDTARDIRVGTERDEFFAGMLGSGHAQLSTQLSVTSADYFDALHALCQLFLRNSSRSRIESSSASLASLATKVRESGAAHHIERVPLQLRAELIHVSYEWLADWPSAFLGFARRAGLSYVHFASADDPYPDWFRRDALDVLRLQRRDVKLHHLESAVEALNLRNEKVTRESVRRQSGAKYPAMLDRMLTRRELATRSEFGHVLRGYKHERGRQASRRSVRISMLRDQVVFCLAAMSRRTFDDVLSLSRAELIELVAMCSSGRPDQAKGLTDTLRSAWAGYLSLESEVCGEVDASARLFCPRAGKGARSAQARLRRHMDGLDDRLWRSVRSFWRACTKTSTI